MNNRLIANGVEKILSASDELAACDLCLRRRAASDCVDAILKSVLQDVLLPEYNRWRDVDGEIGIGASGALANVIAKLTVGLDERPT
jgi:hypothetical protein